MIYDAIKKWIILLCASVVFFSFLELLFPSGKMKNFIYKITGVFYVYVIIYPFVEIVGTLV